MRRGFGSELLPNCLTALFAVYTIGCTPCILSVWSSVLSRSACILIADHINKLAVGIKNFGPSRIQRIFLFKFNFAKVQFLLACFNISINWFIQCVITNKRRLIAFLFLFYLLQKKKKIEKKDSTWKVNLIYRKRIMNKFKRNLKKMRKYWKETRIDFSKRVY